MKTKKTSVLKITAYTTAIILLLALVVYLVIDYVLDFWWFSSVNYATYFALRDSYMGSIAIGITIKFAVIFYINFRLIPWFLGISDLVFEKSAAKGILIRLLRPHASKFLIPLSLLLAVPVTFPVHNNWETVLLYLFSTASGVTDPAYGKDISFYFFTYPVLDLLQMLLLYMFVMVFLITAMIYWQAYKKYHDHIIEFPAAAKVHLTVLVIIVVLLEAWSIALERIELLYENRHLPVFFGPGAVEMGYDLPLIWLTFLAFLGAALSIIFFIYRQRGQKVILGFSVMYVFMLIMRQFTYIPEIIDNYYVKANPLKAEGKYIKYNIDATLQAFKLDQVQKVQHPAVSTLTPEIRTHISESLYNIPLWESDLLASAYEQLQAIQPYFSFSKVSTDRYNLGGKDFQVNIAARELSEAKRPAETKSWKHRHLIYTHGYGAVISPSAQQAGKPVQWFLQDLSLKTQHEKLQLERPEIYYGTGDYQYAIVPNKAPSAIRNEPHIRSDYQGNAGLKISSILRKFLFAVYINDSNIFFSDSISRESRLLVRRNIFKRIHTIAPFLQLDPNPVPAVINKNMYWIVDAYTTSDLYPLVEPLASPFLDDNYSEPGADQYNYIRNSVKIIVDAYNGSVDFYIVDPADPIINAYRRAFPTLFKSVETLAPEFIKHFSYPKLLFSQQMQVYSRYHQTEAEVFYQQSERLQFAKLEEQPIEPFYLTIDPLESRNQQESDQKKFLLVGMFSPYQRDNLSVVTVAGCLLQERCNDVYRDDIFAYQLPLSVQIDGPAQISALINQTPEISREFSLWNQYGSKVIRGRIIVLPIKQLLLYIQPLYLAATNNTGFPQLARVIVAMNHQAVMAESLEAAFNKLEEKLSTQ